MQGWGTGTPGLALGACALERLGAAHAQFLRVQALGKQGSAKQAWAGLREELRGLVLGAHSRDVQACFHLSSHAFGVQHFFSPEMCSGQNANMTLKTSACSCAVRH